MNEKKQLKIWKGAAIALAIILVAVSIMYACGVGYNTQPAGGDASATETAEAQRVTLSLWTEDAPLRVEMEDYIKTVTDESSEDFIPVERRIAVFDWDGTIFCETDPVYFDYCLLKYRVTEDPDYKDKASDFEKETAQKIQDYIDTGEADENLPVEHGQSVASAFKGMNNEEFSAYVKAYMDKPAPGYNNMTIGDGLYKPMVQLIDYLQDNDFTVYIISGTDRLIVRPIVAQKLNNIPQRQVIGSDETLVAKNQGDTDGLEYQFADDDEVITGGEFVVKNLKMNKVSVIAKEIGVQPVLAFGNSSGDFSMATYTCKNNPYKSAAFMLCCDDLERENGNLKKAESMVESCEKNGWTTVSMKNDWTTIYGEDVTRKQAD